MRHTIWRTTCAMLIRLAAAAGLCGPPREVAPEFQSFAGQYVAAINSKDAVRLQALYDAPSRACIAAEDKDFYSATLEGLWREPIPAKYTVTVSAVDENNLKAIETFGRFSVTPARELHIDHQQGDDLRSVVLYLVKENGRWVADQPCPTPETIKNFHDNAAAREHYKALAGAIQEPLRGELIGLLRKHETGTAIDRYHETSGQDMRTSMLVVNALQSNLPQ